MAIDAGEHAAMDRIGEFRTVDVKTDGLAVLSVRQSLVGVTGEAVLVREFVFGPSRQGEGKQ